MPPQFLQSTPTKPVRRGGDGKPLSPAKLSPSSPHKYRYLPQSPVGVGSGLPNNDAKEIAERRQVRQSMTPTKPLAKFDSICPDSKAILNNMAGMFSPKKGDGETPEASPFQIEVEAPPAVFPMKKERGGKLKDRRDRQRRQGQERRKKVAGPARIRRPARTPGDPTIEEGSSKHRP